SIGGNVRYQFRYFREQIIVPVIGYSLEYMHYHFKQSGTHAEQKGSIWVKGPIFGGWILLNAFEPRAAQQFYRNWGTLRSYLTYEAKKLSGENAPISINSFSHYIGLRFEF